MSELVTLLIKIPRNTEVTPEAAQTFLSAMTQVNKTSLFDLIMGKKPLAFALEITVIHQQILIERDSQKAIILGKGGTRLKAIGQAAREAISEHLGRKVHLFLHVKVNPRWDEDRGLYREIGLEWAE